MIKRLFILSNLGLITLGIFFGVHLFYQVVTAQLPPLTAAVSTATESRADRGNSRKTPGRKHASKSFSAYRAIVDRDLFKTTASEKSEAEAEKIELDKLKKTQLNLKLWGTVTGTAEQAYAVIEDKNKHRQGLYHKGDAIQNATIQMILRKKVVLRVNGEDEILTMEDEDKSDRMNAASEQRGAESASRFPPSERVSINRNEIDSALNNINQLMQQARIRPHFKNGKPNGLILSHIRNNSLFKELGLQSGDIVKGVNGEDIKSVDDALKFYHNLKSSASVQLQIERGGEEKSISYQID